MTEIAILKAFEGMPDYRRKQGTRHSLQLCLALFTLAVAAGNQGFLAIGDWLKYHHTESFQGIESHFEVNKGHGRIEKRFIEIMRVNSDDYPDWPDLNTIIRVHRQRSFTSHTEEETN
ncbi:transposase family protein [Gloeocapsa sp. PCC 73106]|uniref:transposase family protein n=1 Tax=Gloeocapsa sp. PCC 73106 TaxID=102232 RepID=UPI0002AB9BCE|nr:transposase family protein [Gloeocapsa sp. PCC 73106]ELR96496.1 hypothetical protein GLO73106DRAFT_00002900 [Gloeocapsa sp. PCC 73106]